MNLRRTIRGGAIGGAVLVYLCLVGMVGRFSDLSLVGTWLTGGGLLLVLPPVVTGAVMTRPRVEAGERRTMPFSTAAVAGAAAGFASGAVLAVGIGLVQLIGIDTVRRVFVSVSPALMENLTLGLSIWGGALLIVIGAATLGGAGALLRSMPRQIRRPIVVGTIAVVALGLLQRVVPSIFDTMSIERDWLYRDVTNGLQTTGALIVFLLSVGVIEGLRRVQARAVPQEASTDALQPREATPEDPRGVPWSRVVKALAVAVTLVALPQIAGPVVSESLGTVGIYVLLGLGLNIVVGYAGLLDLGYVAFFAVGSYSFALLTGSHLITAFGPEDPLVSFHIDPFVAIALVAGIAALMGLVIGAPVVRLRGDYLAIVTLGSGEIARVLLTSDWLQPVFGGARGLRDITDASIGGYGFRQPQHLYYLVVALCLFAAFVSWRLQDSRIGRAWTAMREDEQVADATGVSTVRYKLLAFAMGGAIGSVGGAVYAIKLGSLFASHGTSGVLVSITALAVVVLGGLGSIRGVIVGALVLTGLPDLLPQFEGYRLLVYGAALIAIMLLRPQGLVPDVRRARELLEEGSG